MKQAVMPLFVALSLAMLLSLTAIAADIPDGGTSPVDQHIIDLLGSDDDGNRIFTLKAWTVYLKEYHGLDWDQKQYINERNKFTLDSGEELVKPFLRKFDIYIRSVEDQQAEWEGFHGHVWGQEKPSFFRIARAASVNVPCERCGTTITVTGGSWVRACYSCVCNESACPDRPGVYIDEDYPDEYSCRFHVKNDKKKAAAKYCNVSQHVKLEDIWDDNGTPYPGWENNTCPDHACANADYGKQGCTGRKASGSDYCAACDYFYGDSDAPSGIKATPETGWLRRNNTVTLSATDKSTPIQYRVTSSSGAVIRDWGAGTTVSLGNGTYNLYARDAKGNTSGAVNFVVNNVDTSAPNKPTLSKSPNKVWHNGNVSVTIAHGADNGVSGVARTEYSINGGSSWTTYNGAITVSSTTKVYARTIDRAGNISGNTTLPVNIDKAKPVAPTLNKNPARNGTLAMASDIAR